ncbi:exonuclease VIII [Burkholderia phage Mica]|uniref:RecB-like exonuclease n=1 Tax=Burkholderia phage Mica TaxID=2767579 RepID=A0A873WLV3_9CAUD|nr:exonuclease VIII [Burkholderia phage Mica]QPB08651.1 RecB-like exonuclease [Burkholderia phage Mica]
MNPGIYPNISSADYHGGEGVSNSMLKVLRDQTPMHLHAQRTAANDNRPDTKAFFMGRELHSLVLEPELFVKDYCLAFRQQDMPEAIDDRDVLVRMVEELNAGRQAKLPTGGAKAELVERIQQAWHDDDSEMMTHTPDQLEAMKGAELKAILEGINSRRPGKLSTSGSRHELAEILRANGKPVALWSDVKAEWEKHNGHRRILTPEQWDQLHRMRDAIMAHPAARALLTSSKFVTEHSAYAQDPETGVLRRVRPDLWRFDGIVGDLKTTEDASPEGFARSIAKYGYDVQDPYYLDTLNLALQQSNPDEFAAHPTSAKAFVFIVVEKSFPHAVAVYCLDDESKALGTAKYREGLNTYAECERTGVWPGFGDAVQMISVPQWHLNQNAHLVGAA